MPIKAQDILQALLSLSSVALAKEGALAALRIQGVVNRGGLWYNCTVISNPLSVQQEERANPKGLTDEKSSYCYRRQTICRSRR